METFEESVIRSKGVVEALECSIHLPPGCLVYYRKNYHNSDTSYVDWGVLWEIHTDSTTEEVKYIIMKPPYQPLALDDKPFTVETDRIFATPEAAIAWLQEDVDGLIAHLEQQKKNITNHHAEEMRKYWEQEYRARLRFEEEWKEKQNKRGAQDDTDD